MTNGRPRCLSDRKQNLILFRVYKIICSFVWYDEMIRVSFSSLTRVSATLDQYCLVQLLITSHAAPCQSQDICTCVCRGSLLGAHFQHREGFVFQSFLFGLQWNLVPSWAKDQEPSDKDLVQISTQETRCINVFNSWTVSHESLWFDIQIMFARPLFPLK